MLAHGRDSRIAPGGLYITPTSIYVATTARPIVSPFGFPLASSQRSARVHSGVEAQKEIAPIRLPAYYAATLQNIVTSPTPCHSERSSAIRSSDGGTQSRNLLWDAAEKQVSRLRSK